MLFGIVGCFVCLTLGFVWLKFSPSIIRVKRDQRVDETETRVLLRKQMIILHELGWEASIGRLFNFKRFIKIRLGPPPDMYLVSCDSLP